MRVPSINAPRWRRLGWTAAAVVVLVIVDGLVGDYQVQLLSQAFIFAMAAVSLDVVWGYTGIPDLGHALWFGFGALAVGVATTSLSSTGLVTVAHTTADRYALGLAAGIAAAILVAYLVGRFSFFPSASTVLSRASQFYVAVVTLALTTAATTLYTELSWTGGENGLFGFAVPSLTNRKSVV